MLVHDSSTSGGGFPTTPPLITWGAVSDIVLSKYYMKKYCNVILMHGSAVFLRKVVVFSRTRVVSWEIFYTITCAILFFITSNHFNLKQ